MRRMPPIALHPDNPHYFLFRGQPTVLITSAEHYGAVLNLDFDFKPYLAKLQRRRFNLTRVFSGSYVEAPGDFGINQNTLAPAANRFVCPWGRSGQGGYALGGNRFELGKWDDGYFDRLKAFMSAASDAGVVVEYVLFCPMYTDRSWRNSPMHPDNHVNDVGRVDRFRPLTLHNDGLLAHQEALVRKVVTELRDFDNLYYELCNEPWNAGVSGAWQRRIAEVIVETEQSERIPRHLIAQNICNHSTIVEEPNPNVSILNFHYASGPDTVPANYDLGLAIGDDETGFRGTGDAHYRMEAWQFLLAGGSVFNHLDYSYAAGGHEAGTLPIEKSPGGGGATLRDQLGHLRAFLTGFDFLRLRPAQHLIKRVAGTNSTIWALAEAGKAYAAYATGGGADGVTITLDVAAGRYQVEWVDPLTGEVVHKQSLEHNGGGADLVGPRGKGEIALRVQAA